MNEAKAAGPKTELVGVSGRMQQSIENMIEFLAVGVGDCIGFARTAAPKNPYDRQPSSERDDAAKMVTTTAELLSSIAKLRGEFSQNYHVTRDASAAELALREEKKWEVAHMVSQHEVEKMGEEEYVDYHRKLKRLPPKYEGTFLRQDRQVLPLDPHQLATLEAEVERGSASPTPSPRKKHGSNTGHADSRKGSDGSG